MDYDVLEEMLADAYAGINGRATGIDRMQETVRNWLRDNYIEQDFFQDNGTEQPTGPPAGQKENTAQKSGERYSAENLAIHHGMTDSERAAILKTKSIIAPIYQEENGNKENIELLRGLSISGAKRKLKEIGDNISLFSKNYTPDDIDIKFEFSKGGVKESVDKQIEQKRSLQELAKLMTVLPEVCDGAVEIEKHVDQYVDTYRHDSRLKEMRTMVGAYEEGGEVVFCKIGIKEYLPEAKMPSKLYVVITIDRINKKEAGIIHQRDRMLKKEFGAWRTPASEYSLANLLHFVNDSTGNIVKYFPDQMLTKSQLEIKRNALEEDEDRLRDMRYEYAVGEGKFDSAHEMLREKAEETGYSLDDSWRLAHRAPNSQDDARMDMADQAFGGDGSLYSAFAQMYYGEGRKYDWKAIRVLQKAANDPEAVITVYRAVPNDVRGEHLQNGDWVSTTKEYAQEHGERTFDADYRIIEQKVPAKHLYTDGNSIHEFGYDNGRIDELYKNTENNVKRAGVTYDDTGKLIPLSKRFDESVTDERYSVDDSSSESEQKDSYSVLPAKARDYVRTAERDLLEFMGQALSVPRAARREFLAPIVRAITNEYLEKGSVSSQTIDTLFQKAYAEGIVADEEYYNQYKHIKDHLRTTAVTLAEQDRSDIADFAEFRKRAGGLLKIRNEGGLPVDTAYQELQDMAPELFPDHITHPADQLRHMLEVA